MSLLYLPQTDSTNSWLQRGKDALAHGDAVYTGDQTAGRGRLGRRWENRPGEALYYSAFVRCALKDPGALPLLASLAAADAVAGLCGVRAGVKWPNDLLLGGKKICGILCEGTQAAGAPCWIVGIGLNLNQPQSFFEAAGLDHATSLAAAAGVRCGLQQAAKTLHRAFFERLPPFAAGGFAAIAQEYRAACINLGRRVCTDALQGVAEGIDAEGRLVVATETGEKAVFTGEVSVRGIY